MPGYWSARGKATYHTAAPSQLPLPQGPGMGCGAAGELTGDPLYIHRQSCYLVGRERRVVDIPSDHPSCSKQHACLQFRCERLQQPVQGLEHPASAAAGLRFYGTLHQGVWGDRIGL